MNNSKSYITTHWFIFILWPFFSFVNALRDVSNRSNQFIFIAFSFLFGYSVFFSSGGDIMRYELSYSQIANYRWSDFLFFLKHPLSLDRYSYYEMNAINSKPDIYALSLSFFVSRFTENPRWFWAFASSIYTFTVLNFFNSIKYEVNWLKNSFSQSIFFIALLLIVPFFVGVTGIRFWPALFIFTTYSLKFFNDRKLKFLLLASISILFHYTFIFPLIIMLLASILPNNRFIFKVLTFLGITLFTINTVTSSLNLFSTVASTFEETSIEKSMENYGNEEDLEARKESFNQTNWYVRLNQYNIFYFLVIIGILDVLGVFRYKENSFLHITYPFFFIFLLLAIFTNELGSIGRFKYVYYLLLLSRLLILSGIDPNKNKFKGIALSFLPILIMYTLVSFRAGFYFVDPTLLINNVFAVFFTESEVSLSEFLIGH